jgi:DNA-binding transcriptional LysR family regulator
MMRELKTFLAVVRYGTFAGAGSHIGLTQSAVSAQIQRLEEDLGFALFDRTGRSATLNAAGKQTVEVAEELLSVYARLADRGGAAEQSGLLRVGAIASAQGSFLVSAIQRFRQDSPGWRIRVIPGVSLNLLAQVDSGEVDVAVIIKPPFALPSELKWRTLTLEPFVLLASQFVRRQASRALSAQNSYDSQRRRRTRRIAGHCRAGGARRRRRNRAAGGRAPRAEDGSRIAAWR